MSPVLLVAMDPVMYSTELLGVIALPDEPQERATRHLLSCPSNDDVGIVERAYTFDLGLAQVGGDLVELGVGEDAQAGNDRRDRHHDRS